MQHANLTSHDMTEKVELHRYTEEVVYKRGLNGIHTLFPLNSEPILTPANSLLHHICYTQHHLDQAKLKSPIKQVNNSLFSCYLHSQSQRAVVFTTYSSWVLLAVWTDSLPRESYPYWPITSSRIFWNCLLTFRDSFWNTSPSFCQERYSWDTFPRSIVFMANCIFTLCVSLMKTTTKIVCWEPFFHAILLKKNTRLKCSWEKLLSYTSFHNVEIWYDI